MKTSIFFTFLLFCIFGCTSPQIEQLTQQQQDQIKKEVKAVVDIVMSGFAALDADKALQGYSPEMVACMDSLLIDYQTYAKGWQGYTQSASSIKLTPIKEDYIVLTKDFVIGTWVGRMEMLQKSGDKIIYNPIRYTGVFKKADGQWKIIFEQSSGIPVTQKAQTTQTNLNQVELMKQFLGTWQGEIGKDTTFIGDYKLFGTAIEYNFKIITKGKIIDSGKALWGYDKMNDKFINSEILQSSQEISLYSIWFTAANTFFAVPMADISNPDNAASKTKVEFNSPNTFICTVLKNSKVVLVWTFNRVKK